MDNDLRVLRGRHESLEDDLDNRDMTPPDGTKTLLVQTVDGGSYPTKPGVFYMAVSVEATGDEQEGSLPSLTPEVSTSAFPVLHQGSVAPPVGTVRKASLVGGKWVVQYDG